MKYRYTLKIENENEETTILKIEGWGTSAKTETCLKTIRKDINHSIKEKLDYLMIEQQ